MEASVSNPLSQEICRFLDCMAEEIRGVRRYLNSPEFDIDEDAPLIGARILAHLAIHLSKF